MLSKDYRKSLNKGLYNAFHAKHVRGVFDCIIKDVESANFIPDNEEELQNWVSEIVKDVLIFKNFKTYLIKYVVKAIQKAPWKKNENDIQYESALMQNHMIAKRGADDGF